MGIVVNCTRMFYAPDSSGTARSERRSALFICLREMDEAPIKRVSKERKCIFVITFVIGLVILISGAALYGRLCEKVFGPDDRKTPAHTKNDGVDFVPMRCWKNSLINLLNIAGTGPILGPIQGILFGPIAFLTIPIGNIIGGAMHDYFSGMICLRDGGTQMPEMIRRYSTKGIYKFYNVFVCLLLLLVGAVFIYTPGDIAATQVFNFDGKPTSVSTWVIYGVIFLYYLIATVFPIDAIIGKIYPIFGAILLFSAIGVFIGIFATDMPLLNIWDDWSSPVLSLSDGSTFTYASYFKTGHFLPIFFVTVACGILSGFHSTQTAIISRTMKSERQGRTTFYNMMVLEGFIGMVWAAAAMGVYNLALQEPNAALATGTVGVACKYLLGNVGGIIALLGVIVLPITSGDTALRALRLSLSETLHIDQSTNFKRIRLAVPVFLLVIAILVFAKINSNGFMILWRYFAWANQVLALFAFLCITAWMLEHGKGKWVWMPLIPGGFYAFICATYIANAQIGFHIPWGISYVIGTVCGLAYIAGCYTFGKRRAARLAGPEKMAATLND